jgi:hypothetical protein
MPSMTGDWDNAPPSQRDGSSWPDDRLTAVAAKPKVLSEADQRVRIRNQTHRASVLSELPTSVRYWGICERSVTTTSGYPDDLTQHLYLDITWFESEEALEAWVLQQVEARNSYKVFRSEPVVTEVKAVFTMRK